MFPEIVIADDPGNLQRYRVLRCKIPCDDPGCADIRIDMKEGNLFFYSCDLLLALAVMIPPLNRPAV
ncbi:hypothetical protein [Methanoregula sp.]|uniref:hypothetical protein n=1 Tax=Methanoregula sp. TaxID=2052170 RepID=UPI0035647306